MYQWWGLLHGSRNVWFPIINCCWCEWKTRNNMDRVLNNTSLYNDRSDKWCLWLYVHGPTYHCEVEQSVSASLCSPLSDALVSLACTLIAPSLPSLSVLSFQVYTLLLFSCRSLLLGVHCFPSPIDTSPLLQSCLSLFQCCLSPLHGKSSGAPFPVVVFL